MRKGRRGAVLLALLLLAGQVSLVIHQADHLAKPAFQGCLTCLSLHLDDAVPPGAERPHALQRRHEQPAVTLTTAAAEAAPANTRIRSPPPAA